MAGKMINSDIELVADVLSRMPAGSGSLANAVAVLGALAGAERLRSDDLSGVEIQLRAALAECALPRRDGTPDWGAGGAYALKRLAKRLGIEL